MKPITETNPETIPIKIDPQGPITKSEDDPTATPPANVAF